MALSVEGPDGRGVARLTLSRPGRANALNPELVEAILDALSTAATDGTRVLVLRGEGRNFCAGFDLSADGGESDATLALRFIRIEQMLQTLATAPFLTIACVQGAAFGAGADIVVACDQRFALPEARFRFPGYGFSVALGTRRLAAITGAAAAQDMLASGRIVSSEEALACRLLTAILTPEAMTAKIDRLADSMAALDPSTVTTLVTHTRQPKVDPDGDLAILVRSVVRPGLRERLQMYAGRITEARSS
jgi:enoyl-CoA hydratase/carnithine racemase